MTMYLLVWEGGAQMKVFPSFWEMKAFLTTNNIAGHKFYSLEGGDEVPTDQNMKMQESGLVRLMYVSRALVEIPKEVLTAMAQGFARRNAELGITGFLIYSPPLFFQTIEGRDEDIMYLYAKISRDPRHCDCAIIQKTPAFHRLYSNWHMKDSHIDNISSFSPLKLVLGRLGSATPIQRFMSPATTDTLLCGGDPVRTPPIILNAVVFFAEMHGFHLLYHHSTLGTVTPWLMTRFLDECCRCLAKHGGKVLKIHGGTILATFSTLQADAALQCGKDLQDTLAALRAKNTGRPLGCLHGSVALHFGQLVLMNLGSKRSDFTVLGDTVNTTARLLKLGTELNHSLLVSLQVRRLLASNPDMEDLGEHSVKGKETLLYVFAAPGYAFSARAADDLIVSFAESVNDPEARVVKELSAVPAEERPPLYREGWMGNPRKSITASTDDSLIVLTYISEARSGMTQAEVDQLITVSTQRNQRNGITGVLLFTSRFFIQTLEGNADRVQALYEKIKNDHRHYNCVLVQLEKINQRTYPGWYMMSNALEAVSRFPPLEAVVAQLCHMFVSVQTYLPSPVLRTLQRGKNPLDLPVVRTNAIVFVSDLIGFTSLSEKYELRDTTRFVTSFIDVCTQRILQRQGEVMKFIGDCVVAYYSPDQARSAFQAAVDINADICQLRAAAMGEEMNSKMFAGMALVAGDVIIGNVGTEFVDFALLGDGYSTALAVESATRRLGSSLLLSRSMYELLPEATRALLQLTGEVEQTGSRSTIAVYSPTARQFRLDDDSSGHLPARGHHSPSGSELRPANGSPQEEIKLPPLHDPQKARSGSDEYYERRTSWSTSSASPVGHVRQLRQSRTQTSLLTKTPSPTPSPSLDDSLIAVTHRAIAPACRLAPAVWYKISCLRLGIIPNPPLLASLENQTTGDVVTVDCSAKPVVGCLGLPAVVDALVNMRVGRLDVRGNDLDDRSIASIAAACLMCPELVQLDLRDNPRVTAGSVLRDLAVNCAALVSLSLDNTRVTAADRRFILSVCERRARS